MPGHSHKPNKENNREASLQIKMICQFHTSEKIHICILILDICNQIKITFVIVQSDILKQMCFVKLYLQNLNGYSDNEQNTTIFCVLSKSNFSLFPNLIIDTSLLLHIHFFSKVNFKSRFLSVHFKKIVQSMSVKGKRWF